MTKILTAFNPRYLVDKKGKKTAVVIDFDEYQSLMEFIEDIEDARDLLKAELKASGFTPYEEFREKWLNHKTTA
jgi:PHD/YefM family antitoxin component YafN of YafNO toxin-antitoxin module